MKLSREGIKDRKAWEEAGVSLPSYNYEAAQDKAKASPEWVHFGIGNIFRIFIGGIADTLLARGEMDRGITCVESFDFDVVDKIYDPYDNLVLGVTLRADGSTDKRVIASLAEAIKTDAASYGRLKAIFTDPGLKMCSFTITEKGYALCGADGKYFPFVQADIDQGPAKDGESPAYRSAMSLVAALLYERYKAGKYPIAVVSMDNCSHNGEKLMSSIVAVARAWEEKGCVPADFVSYLTDKACVSFPWSMIDKITPRPAESVQKELEKLGIEDMAPVITSKKTYIAPFVNAEGPQYLVIEDEFPNGRPPLENAGVYMTTRDTVNRVERMKVTTCLNPLHTALAVYGCLLGYTLIADEMKDPLLKELVCRIGPVEGMPVVTDPGILSPQDFVDEVINVRIPNPFMPDTPQRIATDTSQKVGIRYGETIKAYVARDGDAGKLQAIPLAIAGWLRYLLGVDDKGQAFERSADPMLDELTQALKGLSLGDVDADIHAKLAPILSNANIFGSDLYKAGIGEKIEALFREEIQGPGAIYATLKKYLG